MTHTELAELVYDLPYSWSHNITKKSLGNGTLYATLPKNTNAQLCVCIGSGAGIVPILLRETTKGRVILIDALNGINGSEQHSRPYYEKLRANYPTLEIIFERSETAVSKIPNSIDFLHIDGDHTYEGVKIDWELYSPKVRRGGYITIHDTDESVLDKYDWYINENRWNGGPARLVREIEGYSKVDYFDGISTGVTLLQKL